MALTNRENTLRNASFEGHEWIPQTVALASDVFEEFLDEYRAGRMSLSAPLVLLQSWIERFDQPYLRAQTYLEPYPRELLDLRDSARAN